jgi:hypothetical protein
MEIEMTPEERQLLTTLAERIKSTPPQQEDMEAAQLLEQLVRERPDTVYVLAQTVLMQDFGLRNAQAQIEDLQRKLSWEKSPSERGSGSFLGGLERSAEQYPLHPEIGSVPSVNPWAKMPSSEYSPSPPEPRYPDYAPSGPVVQPSQTSGFLRNAAAAAAGIAGGALLFQGINSLFAGHHRSLLGADFSSLKPADSLSATTVAGTHRSDAQALSEGGQHGAQGGADRDQDPNRDADYGDDDDFDGGDYA